MRLKVNRIAVSFILLAVLALPAAGAEVKPLKVFSEKILILEIEHFASELSMSSALVRKAIDRLNSEMNIMSPDRTQEALKLLATARGTLAEAMRSSAALSSYVSASSGQLKSAGHERFLPLARLDKEIEKPFYEALDRFLATAGDFVQFCNDNFEAVATGQEVERRQYDRYYAAYLREMDKFNSQSVTRSEQIAEWANEYPSLWELLPR